ncbi:MAG: O-acetyl-ADP-ribose deacetylase [Candidatus Korobacteraceae bacterium]|jgi:O-acetyl-ADP-ribose deacetylase (regulator of RNase III)
MNDFYKIDLGEGSTLVILQGDITRQEADAIVNAANSTLMGGGGVDGAIHRAGGPAILEECKKIVAAQGHLPPGEAVSTTGGRLTAAFVIHTVGPIWRGGMHGEPALLAGAYRNSLRLADRLGLHNLAFPAISTGVYGYPASPAAEIAIETAIDALVDARNVREVRFVLFDRAALETFLEAAHTVAQRRQTKWRIQHVTQSQ